MLLTRRDLISLGIMGGGAAMMAGVPRLLRATDTLPRSPRLTQFVTELLPGRGIPPIARPVARFPTQADPAGGLNPDGTTAFHLSGPRRVPANTEFFQIHERPVLHSFHPQLPLNLLFGYNGLVPGPTVVATSGTPQLVRFFNDLPDVDPVGIG